MKDPILKNLGTDNIRFSDIIDMYGNGEVTSPYGRAKLISINRKKKTCIISNQKVDNLEVSINSIKFMLRKMSSIARADIINVAKLAVNDKNFKFKTKRSGNNIVCQGDDYDVTINPDTLSIIVSDKNLNKKYISNNIPFIIAYLFKRNYDIFGLIKKGLAVQSFTSKTP